MGITQRVDQMMVRVSSPGGSIFAEIHGRDEVRLSFAPGYYYRVDKPDMETQLSTVGRLLWVARMREYYRIISDQTGQTITGDVRAESFLDTQFYEQRARLVAEGRSTDGRIHIQVRGLTTWTVRITDGTLNDLSPEEFAASAASAAAELIHDQHAKVRELRVQTYTPELVSDFVEA